MVELAEETSGWPYEEQLAVVAHEGSHVAISHYFEQAELGDDAARFVFNFLEDARVHQWLGRHFDGLRQGVAALERRALASYVSPLTRAERFLVRLRARTMGVEVEVETDPRIDEAIAACLATAHEAIHAIPGREDRRNHRSRACSLVFVRGALTALHWYRRLLDPGDRSRRVEVETSWIAWRMRRVGALDGRCDDWEHHRRTLAPQITRLVSSLKRALPPNDSTGWTGGHRSGPRICLPVAMAAEHDPRLRLRAFERRTPSDRRTYRLGLAFDLSQSMAGEPIHQVAKATVLLLEAAERLSIPSTVVVFGRSLAEPSELLKDRSERLAVVRRRLEAALITAPSLGGETPLAEAVHRLRLLHDQEPDTIDLLLIVTDGAPRASREAYDESEAKTTFVDDSGNAREGVRPAGWHRIWDAGYEASCAEAIRRAERDGCVLVGIGLGLSSPPVVGFPRFVSLPDVTDLPDALASVLRQVVRGRVG